MSNNDYIADRNVFDRLWKQALAGRLSAFAGIRAGSALYFDSSDICTLKYHAFIQSLLAETGDSAFATVVMQPAPYDYFYHHFSKYPAFVFRAEHSDRDYISALNSDPGGSLADAFDANSVKYAVFPLSCKWIIYGDRTQDLAVMAGPRNILECTRRNYPFTVFENNPGFVIDPQDNNERED